MGMKTFVESGTPQNTQREGVEKDSKVLQWRIPFCFANLEGAELEADFEPHFKAAAKIGNHLEEKHYPFRVGALETTVTCIQRSSLEILDSIQSIWTNLM